MFTIALQKWFSAQIDAIGSRLAQWQRQEAQKQQIAEERKQLLELDQRMLSDIGRTREEAVREAARDALDVSAERFDNDIDRVQKSPASFDLAERECCRGQV